MILTKSMWVKQKWRLLKSAMFMLLCMILVSCASTDDQIESSATSKISNKNPQASQRAERSRPADLEESILFKVTNQAGEVLSGVLVISSILIDDSSKYIYNRPNQSLTEAGLRNLATINDQTWLDYVVHKPDQRLRIVGITDSDGEVRDLIERYSITKALNQKKQLPVVYGFLKRGHEFSIKSWDLKQVMDGTSKNLIMKKSGDSTPSLFDTLVASHPSIFGKNEALTFSPSGETQRRLQTEARVSQQPVPASQLIRAEFDKNKEKLSIQESCRLRYWLAKAILNEMKHSAVDYPGSVQEKEISEQLQFIKTQCLGDTHLQALRLVDERDIYLRKRQWYYREKVPARQWPEDMNWARFKQDWIRDAAALDKTSGKSLWPVFHRTLSQMYYQGYWLQQYEKLTQFKADFPQIYGRRDEQDRASSAFMTASKYKRMSKMTLDQTRLESTRESALKWFKLASEMGNCVADREIGDMYENGILVPVDFKQALFWYRNGLFKDCQLPQVLAEFQERIIRVLKMAEEKSQLKEVLELPASGTSNFKSEKYEK